MRLAKNFGGLGVKFLNVGGSKTPSELGAVSAQLDTARAKLGAEYLILEPARYSAGDTMDLMSKIVRVKTVKGKEIVVIRNGIYGGLLDEKLYGKRFDLALEDDGGRQVKVERQKTAGAGHVFQLCGGSSDSGDRMGFCFVPEGERDLLRAGTKVVVKNVGTYCLEFNMPLGGDLEFEIVAGGG